MPEIILLGSNSPNPNLGYFFLKEWVEPCGRKSLGTEVGVWDREVFLWGMPIEVELVRISLDMPRSKGDLIYDYP